MTPRNKIWDVVVFGDFFMDLVMTGFCMFPRPGEEAFAETMRREIGGGAAITSCGLARLERNVAVLGLVGKEDGAWIVESLTREGVNASSVKHNSTKPSGGTVRARTSADRSFYPS